MMHLKESKSQVQILVDILNQDNRVVEMLVVVCTVILEVLNSCQNLKSFCCEMNIHCRTEKNH